MGCPVQNGTKEVIITGGRRSQRGRNPTNDGHTHERGNKTEKDVMLEKQKDRRVGTVAFLDALQMLTMSGLAVLMAAITNCWLPRSSNIFLSFLWGVALVLCCAGMIITLFFPIFGQGRHSGRNRK